MDAVVHESECATFIWFVYIYSRTSIMRSIQRLALFVTYLAVLAGCTQSRSASLPAWDVSATTSVSVRELPVAGQAPCEGHFVEHQLLFATGVRIREINTYESNGAGLAINDLDKD